MNLLLSILWALLAVLGEILFVVLISNFVIQGEAGIIIASASCVIFTLVLCTGVIVNEIRKKK